MTLGIPGIDEQKVLELYEGNYSIYFPVLRAYAEETPAVLKKLRNVSEATLADYARVMHGVKGTSASACAEEARKNAVDLQTLAKEGNLSGVLARNASFLKYMENLVAGIQNWLIRNNK